MKAFTLLSKLTLAGVILLGPAMSNAQIVVSVGFAPPALPVYVQPICPSDGYLWTPGYWAYASAGYYWVPGVWTRPPSVGLLWTPPYWGFAGGVYGFHAGYWGHAVGFYGGVNYGFGYGGVGFGGGYWQGGNFMYNRSAANLNVNIIHNTYERNVTVNNASHTSFNGGPGGIQARPNAEQLAAEHAQHFGATSNQQQHFQAAQQNHAQYASANGGHPGTLAMQSNRSGFGHANEVNTRQGNQQSRSAHGVRSGQVTPGEENNLERRDNSIHNQARADRAANGGRLTGPERQQIIQRQNRVSQSIDNDRHNANNDAAAAARHGVTPGQERHQAQGERQEERPRGPEARR